MRQTLPFSRLSLWSATVNGYANPLACSGVCTNAHDPAIIRRDDGTYFRFSTRGKIAIHSAPAITGPWTYKGAVVPAGSKIDKPGRNDLWAPDVQKVGDTYYLYYSVSSLGSQNSAIGIATSKTLDVNSWTDAGATGIASDSSEPYNAIDGNVKLGSPPTKVASGRVAINQSGQFLEKAAYVYKYGSYYYLFFSVGICCGYDGNRPAAGAEYKIKACRSSSPTGNFVDKGGVSCRSGGGTTGVFSDPSLGPVLYYHYVDTRVGYGDGQKRFGLNKIDFSSGWPVV
ncbi:endo-1,5-alpha-L-arabinosidase [Byssothecium circinans]|uniref:arabinan endo-1,5-alpha-L-arabinosidase n=1 Tax=Byssothecium circinans TaxID=147558 RepID=A0A6A5U2J2_9PLEO|nr:endo-1,5-alpha-L-arabinosidase [Byssothecium circinans]